MQAGKISQSLDSVSAGFALGEQDSGLALQYCKTVAVGWGVDLAAVAPKLVLGNLPPWRAEESSKHIHSCIGVVGACLCTACLLGSVARAVVRSSFSKDSK